MVQIECNGCLKSTIVCYHTNFSSNCIIFYMKTMLIYKQLNSNVEKAQLLHGFQFSLKLYNITRKPTIRTNYRICK